MEKTIDVFGVGNAIVDMLAMVPDQFIAEQQLQRASMTLMETDQQARILHALGDHKVELASGGSAANTLVAVAQSGGSGVYCGKVAHDTNGEFYRQDMEESGIRFPVAMAPESADPTGTCVVLTTPDAERTMCTHLGVSTSLSVTDLDWDLLARCKYSYIEGYLWDAPGPREACLATFRKSAELGVKTSFTFSDLFLVQRYRDAFLEVVPGHCDVLFCNADEARQLLQIESLEECCRQLAPMAEIVFVTDGPNGCTVIEHGTTRQVDAFQVKAIDTVGAGDAFAGGALYALANNLGSLQAARWGNFLASEVVAKTGPRLNEPQIDKRETVLMV